MLLVSHPFFYIDSERIKVKTNTESLVSVLKFAYDKFIILMQFKAELFQHITEKLKNF